MGFPLQVVSLLLIFIFIFTLVGQNGSILSFVIPKIYLNDAMDFEGRF